MAMKKYTSVQEYLEDQSGIHLEMLKKIESLIMEEVPNAEPGISYGMPAYKKDVVIAGFYAYKNHISYYPHAGGLLEKHADALNGYKHTKGTLQIGIDQAIPEEVIRKLIREKIAMAHKG